MPVQLIETIDCLQIVLKAAEVCNIRCKYCYYYFSGLDVSSHRPAILSNSIQQNIAPWLRSAISRFAIKKVIIALHGGEPTLAPPKLIADLIDEVHRALPKNVELGITIQTNGVAISKEWLSLMIKYRMHVGVSIDGDRVINDAYRLDHMGKSTYDRVIVNLDILSELSGKSEIASLSTISVLSTDGQAGETYTYLSDRGSSEASFLLPDRNHNALAALEASDSLRLAEQLADAMVRWIERPSGSAIFVQGREWLARSYRQREGSIASDSHVANCILVVHTDGAIALDDSLMPAAKWYEAAAEWSLKSHSLEYIISSNTYSRYRQLFAETPTACKACAHVSICRGGDLEHRYSSDRDFDNPSVYCGVYKKIFPLVSAIADDLRRACSEPN